MIILSGVRTTNRSECDYEQESLLLGINMIKSGDTDSAIKYLTRAFGSEEAAEMWIRFSSIDFETMTFGDCNTDDSYVNLASSIIKMMNTRDMILES